MTDLKRYAALTACVLIVSTLLGGCSTDNRTTATVPAPSTEPINSKVIYSSPNAQKITFHSESLGKDMKFNIYLPIGYTAAEKFPVLYLMHGYNGTESDWFPIFGIDKKADELLNEGKINPIIIVSPEIDNSYGLNTSTKPARRPCAQCSDEGKYSDYIVKDLIQFVDGHFSTVANREGRYIGGFSMGGYVALYNAFQHPELFSKAGGHSPALWMEEWSGAEPLKKWLYPNDAARKQRDPLRLAETRQLTGLSVYLDCGEQDRYKFYQGAEALFHTLQSKNIKSEYHHSPGAHDGQYWEKHVGDYLLFYAGK